MAFTLRSWIPLLAFPLGLLAVGPGCGRQPEGERCNRANGNLDCQNGGSSLVCTVSSELRRGDDKVDRCCPARGETITDSRCERRVGGNEGGAPGEGGAPATGATNNEGGSTTVGQSGDGCSYNSECDEGLICGPGGVCQPECRVTRDCDSGEVCSAFRCVPAEGGSGS